MATIELNFYATSDTATGGFAYNSFAGALATAVAQISSDLKDTTNVSTGYTLDIVAPFTGATGSTTNATSGVVNFPDNVLDYYWYAGSTATLRIGGLTNGDSYTVECIGHQSTQPTRDTDFTVGGATTRYDNAGVATPNEAISFTGTVSGTTLDIDAAVVASFAYLNALRITITSSGVSVPTGSKTNMTTIAKYLRDNHGYVGSVDDVITAWLTDETGTTGAQPDLWKVYLDSTQTGGTTKHTFPGKFREWQKT
jgi:hypothetical protein